MTLLENCPTYMQEEYSEWKFEGVGKKHQSAVHLLDKRDHCNLSGICRNLFAKSCCNNMVQQAYLFSKIRKLAKRVIKKVLRRSLEKCTIITGCSLEAFKIKTFLAFHDNKISNHNLHKIRIILYFYCCSSLINWFVQAVSTIRSHRIWVKGFKVENNVWPNFKSAIFRYKMQYLQPNTRSFKIKKR